MLPPIFICLLSLCVLHLRSLSTFMCFCLLQWALLSHFYRRHSLKPMRRRSLLLPSRPALKPSKSQSSSCPISSLLVLVFFFFLLLLFFFGLFLLLFSFSSFFFILLVPALTRVHTGLTARTSCPPATLSSLSAQSQTATTTRYTCSIYIYIYIYSCLVAICLVRLAFVVLWFSVFCPLTSSCPHRRARPLQSYPCSSCSIIISQTRQKTISLAWTSGTTHSYACSVMQCPCRQFSHIV